MHSGPHKWCASSIRLDITNRWRSANKIKTDSWVLFRIAMWRRSTFIACSQFMIGMLPNLDLDDRGEDSAYSRAFSEPRPCRTMEMVESSKSWQPILLLVVYTKGNLMYIAKQGTCCCLAQAGFAAFGKGVQLIDPYAETKQLSRLASPSRILPTSWR